jgi:hypothetical protein
MANKNSENLYISEKSFLYDVWDSSRIVNTEESYEQRVHFFHLSLQILKIATYVILSLIVLTSAIVSKGSLLLMTNAVGHVESVSSLTNKQNKCVANGLALIKAINFEFLF